LSYWLSSSSLLLRSHSLQHAHARSAVTVLSVDAIFAINEHGEVTLFRCGDVSNNLFNADFLLSVTVKEFFKNGPTSLKYLTDQSIQLTFLSHPVSQDKNLAFLGSFCSGIFQRKLVGKKFV